MLTKEVLIQTLTALYATTGVINMIGYWPTIKDLYHKKPSANISSYTLWTIECGIGLLYGSFVISDLYVQIVYALATVACATVLFLSIRLKVANNLGASSGSKSRKQIHPPQ